MNQKARTVFAAEAVTQEVTREEPRRVWLYTAAALLSMIGLADATYLTAEHMAGRSVRCGVSTGCSEVLSSAYATVGSMPLAALGAVAYFAAFSCAVLAAFGYRQAGTLLTFVVAVMFVVSVWLLFVQAFVLHAFCYYCLLSAAVTLLLTIIVFAKNISKSIPRRAPA